MFNEKQIEEFTAGYIAALLWSSVVSTDDGEDINADQFELSTAGADKCNADCLAFCNDFRHLLEEYGEEYTPEEAGHDFALTRNGHGAGFWDRDYLSSQLADALTNAAQEAGEIDCWLNDNNEIELS